jgi:hypothetical protein
MTLFSNARSIGFACLLIAVGSLSARADVEAADASQVLSGGATMLAFNPQPDPPGAAHDEDFTFDHG